MDAQWPRSCAIAMSSGAVLLHLALVMGEGPMSAQGSGLLLDAERAAA